MNLKFKNRIALFNLLAVAMTTALVFIIIYFVVHDTAYRHLDEHIASERDGLLKNMDMQDDTIILDKIYKWDENIHQRVEVSPVFIQVLNKNGRIIFSSSSLLKKQRLEKPKKNGRTYSNSTINHQRIRLGWFPIKNNKGDTVGGLVIAISGKGTYNVLNNLIWTLLISFPIVLFILFLASSLAASRAIKPVNRLIQTASKISDTNISTRLKLPMHKDELFDLTTTLNELLDRIENSMIQQKQFTSDASHEMRTPIAAIRGTLEVLLRKEREPQKYIEKISGIIKEFDRLDAMLDQLLQLARIESEKVLDKERKIRLYEIVNDSMKKWSPSASIKKISLSSKIPKDTWVHADHVYLELILDNLLSNAIKYGKKNGNVFLSWDSNASTLAIQDNGIGITQEHLPNIFNRFYRADESRSSTNVGNGLGLSIVKKLAHLQSIEIDAESIPDKGSTFYLQFPD